MGWVEIPLTRGFYAKVDVADYALVAPYSWFANEHRGKYYAATKSGLRYAYMHRLILGLTRQEDQADHINGDRLDNRRTNLRPCTNTLNHYNKPAPRCRRKTSVYKGVHWAKKTQSWCVQIKANRITTTVGHFRDEVEAALAYDAAARVLHGRFARLNLPHITDEPIAILPPNAQRRINLTVRMIGRAEPFICEEDLTCQGGPECHYTPKEEEHVD